MSATQAETEDELHEDEPTGEVALFAEIGVVSLPTDTTVEVQISDEVREVEVRWDDSTNTATTISKEVAVVTIDNPTHKVDICQLEIFDNDGVYKAYPLTKLAGNVEWLYPSKKTKITRIKAYIRDEWKWISAQTNNQSHGSLTANCIAACRQVDDPSLGVTLRYPISPTFVKIGNKWRFDGDDTNISWISTIQKSIYPRLEIGDIVYLQGELGSANPATFQISGIVYEKLCQMARLVCYVGNKQWRRKDTTVVPLVQLIDIRKVRR
ncbi:MAG: hypothetical protein KME52_09915 [Desmonostoc geniculatum HA4340-LM1]|nr:hypothetical protein [Desmonostoc geniculatum HA4340-LM1]